MPRNITIALCAALALLSSDAVPAAPSSADTSMREFGIGANLALQGDVKGALTHFDAVSPATLTKPRRAVWSCIRARFRAVHPVAAPAAELDPLAARLLADYRAYWRRVMLHEASVDDAGHALAATLARRVKAASGTNVAADMDAIEPRLDALLAQRGYHALFGVTAPMREFMLWRTEADARYTVELPGGMQNVQVVWLDGFASLGWAGYASCDYYHTAGWAKPDKLYALRSAYDVDSESFRVSYLMHEGQHFADYQRHPGMASPDLEYRAKLVELANAHATLYDLLDGFADNESESRELPHPWANREAVIGLAQMLLHGAAPSAAAWKSLPPVDINAAARQLFERDEQRRSVHPAAQ